MMQPVEPEKTCPECGSRHAIHTGHLKGTSRPTFEGDEAKPYDDKETEYEWQCERGHRFWSPNKA